ncbi:hypothetical protein V5N11_000524 [Cardamine amara subsp. amara]|uniref:U3 small nucleolar RNA-associated protein 20 domain-containing protein n=1 Tax=Cardamine amara subsp. amara TaxID=228776 RepID=A0ABD0ZQK6_CARAN
MSKMHACKEALAAVSAHMSWTLYYALLNRCFHEMTTHTNKRELMLQLIGLILNNFHFSKDGYTQEATDSSTCIEKTVFPKLMSSDYDSVNVYSYVVAVRILKLLPKEIMDPYLDSIVPKISGFLRSKDEKIRDKARNALAACLKALGLEYLQLVFKKICARFKPGSQVRELRYNVYSILSKCLSTPTGGKLDHCLGDLLAVVKTDILGDVDEQKEERKFASKKKKETITCKSLETLKLIAENVTFRSHVLKLLSPISAQLESPLTTKLKSILEEMLKYIAAGIEANLSVDHGDLFCFIYDRLDGGINNRSGLGDEVSSPSSKKKRKSRDLQNTTGAKSCPQLITLFGLNLLHNRLKKLNINNTNEELVSKLETQVKP